MDETVETKLRMCPVCQYTGNPPLPPGCGSTLTVAPKLVRGLLKPGEYTVQCQNCGWGPMMCSWPTQQEAIADWNDRSGITYLTEKIWPGQDPIT